MSKPEKRTLIIAEAGVNHNGSLALAKELVDAAVSAGADIVKFQTFRAEQLVTKSARKADYQVANTQSSESQFAMLKKLELSPSDHFTLRDYCKEKGIEFLSTAFDSELARFLVHEVGVRRLKVPSGELTNAELLLSLATFKKSLIVSTGMANLEEIEAALGVLAFGFLATGEAPSTSRFQSAFKSSEGQALLQKNVSLLHCTTDYPARPEEIHLRAMETMRSRFGLPVGYSDHSEGVAVSLAAAALGAEIIEKHFTMDRELPGPDHLASLEPGELKELIKGIRTIDLALGDFEKKARPRESGNIAIARKSLVAARPIRAGELFNSENLTLKRPGNGISAIEFWDWLGKPANRDFAEDELIQ